MEDPAKNSLFYSQSNLTGISMWPGILKLVHQFLLQSYPPKDVWEFWKNNLPHSVHSPSDIQAFFDSILITNTNLPFEYVFRVLAACQVLN